LLTETLSRIKEDLQFMRFAGGGGSGSGDNSNGGNNADDDDPSKPGRAQNTAGLGLTLE
jgi:hypothetical protein